jgi:hypothetical protein
MKAFSAGLLNSYASRVSTICNCLKIIRLDGVTYRFTDLDVDIEVLGETYDSSISFNPSTYSSALGLQIENMEVAGPVDNLGINDFDIIKNLFYGAEIWVFSVDYKNVTNGTNNILYGTIGEIELTDKTFKFELRGISKRYVNLYSNYYGKICRAKLGDDKCKVNLPYYMKTGTVNDSSLINNLVNTKYLYFSNLTKTNSNSDYKLYEVKLLDTLENNLTINNVSDLYYTDGSTLWSCGVTTYSKTNIVDNDLSTFACIKYANISYKAKSFIIELTKPTPNIRYLEIYDDATDRLTNATISTSLDGYTYTSLPIPSLSTFRSGDKIRIDLGMLLSAKFSNRYKFTSHDLSGIEENYFQYGKIKWLTGLNSGLETEVITSTSGGFVELALPMTYNISDGDTFEIYPGCNHLLMGRDGTPYSGHCFSRYDNVINFRGEPYLPNEDVLLSGFIAVKESREAESDDEAVYLEPV